jgi:hypothetical protein
MPRKRRDPDLPDPSPVPPEDESHDVGDSEQSNPSPPTQDPPTTFEADQLPVELYEEEPPTLKLPPPDPNQPPVPPVVAPTSQAPPMPDVKTIEPPVYNPVSSVVRTVKAPPQVQIRMVNDRASHFYFKRVLSQLRALGKYR